MADTRTLINGLREYRDSLKQHGQILKSQFADLQTQWYRLSQIYHGEGADQLRGHWSKTVEFFNDYIDQTQRIHELLLDRLESLEDFDRENVRGISVFSGRKSGHILYKASINLIFEVMDQQGILVRLDRSVWKDKILAPSPKGHPEVEPYLDQVKETISNPDLVMESAKRTDVRIYYRLRAGQDRYEGKHLLVIVKYVFEKEIIVGYVSTTYLTRKIVKGKQLWIHPILKDPS